MTKDSVCLTPYLRKHTSYDCDFWYMCKMMISLANFFIFQNFDFLGFLGDKRVKNELKLPISICYAQSHRNYKSYHQDFNNDFNRCFSLLFLKKCNIANIKILFFNGPLQQFFLIIICFSSSSINAKKKF